MIKGKIRGTEGSDGDKLDVYVGDNHDSSLVVVIHQHNPWDGAYDEDKVMLGFESLEEAIGAYKKQYDRPGFYKDGEHTALPIGAFWRWVQDERNKGKRVKMARALGRTMWKRGYTEGKPGAINTAKDTLASVLGLLRSLAWNHLASHWQVGGSSSYGDHLLFERIYSKVTEETDGLAEKMVGMFGPSAVDAQKQASILAKYIGAVSAEECPYKRALHMETVFQKAIKMAVADLEELDQLSLGLDDFLRTLANDHETAIYLLQQRLSSGKTASIISNRGRLACVALKRIAALAGTDSASFYVIAPEQLYKVIENGLWFRMAELLWGDTPAKVMSEDMETIIRRHGGAVLHTGADGFWDVVSLENREDSDAPLAVNRFEQGEGYLPPFGWPKQAGWWAMRPGKPGIHKPPGYSGEGLLNAIPGVHGPLDSLYNGDGPADIMDAAIKDIIAEYKAVWGRPPYAEELQGVWDFTSRPVLEDDLPDLSSSIDEVIAGLNS